MELRVIIPWIIVIGLALFLLNGFFTKKTNPGKWTVYGTMSCGWTRKQLDHLKSKGIDHEFIDCKKNDCSGMRGYPVNIKPNGEKVVGFTESM